MKHKLSVTRYRPARSFIDNLYHRHSFALRFSWRERLLILLGLNIMVDLEALEGTFPEYLQVDASLEEHA